MQDFSNILQSFPLGWQLLLDLCHLFLILCNPASSFFLSQMLLSGKPFIPQICLSICFPEDPADTDGMLLAPTNLSFIKGVDIFELDLSWYQENK